MSEDRGLLRFLLTVLALLVAPHLFHLHWSHTGLFLGFWLWRWLGIRRPALLPRGSWLPLLTLGAAVVVIVSRRGAIDLTTSTGLFVAGLGLKLMELKGERDLYFVVFLGWFVALTQFLYDQSLGMALYAFAAAVLLTTVLVRGNAAGSLPRRALVATVAALLGPALPLTVVLFLFFPRPHGGFFHLPFDTRAVTGLSEIMEPGAVARLATSSAVAFRVDFEGDLPPPDRRYWRAQVFWRFDGRRWLPYPAMRQSISQPPAGMGTRYRYRVTVEPHHRRWLFSLGVPASVPEVARLTREGVLEARYPVDERVRYPLVSYSAYRFPPLSPLERRLALQLPGEPDPRVRALVARLRRQGDGPRVLAKAVLAHFRAQGFRYTLDPGRMADPITDFLFGTRAGFCEHYAGAFVYLMRAAGVPARVVGGYLGGFVNPRGGFLEVYQANAHAWAEIWVDGAGWVRVDPTEAVAPRYVAQVRDLPDPLGGGLAAAPSPAPVREASAAAGRREAAGWRTVWRELRIVWSDLDHRWHLWVLGYDRRVQVRLFAWMVDHWPGLVLGLAAVLAFTSGWRGRRRDPLAAAYDTFLQRMRRRGLVKAPHETPTAFAARVGRHVPEATVRVQAITERFLQAHYGRGDRIEAARRIRAELRRLR